MSGWVCGDDGLVGSRRKEKGKKREREEGGDGYQRGRDGGNHTFVDVVSPKASLSTLIYNAGNHLGLAHEGDTRGHYNPT